MKSETTEAHEKLSTDKIIGGVITLSDSITDVNDDISGKILADAIETKYTLASRKLIPDDRNDLTQAIEEMLEDVDFIITTGGTGLNERDITVETVEKLFDKKMEGFGELYRQESYKEIGLSSILSRATAGVYKKTLIFSLPGSPNAVKTGLRIIIDELPHIVFHAKG